jgi:hypothetical protein
VAVAVEPVDCVFVVTVPGTRVLDSVKVLVDVSELPTDKADVETIDTVSELPTDKADVETIDTVSEDIKELVALGTITRTVLEDADVPKPVLEDTEGVVLERVVLGAMADLPDPEVIEGLTLDEGVALGVVDVPSSEVVDGVVKIAGEEELEGVVVVNIEDGVVEGFVVVVEIVVEGVVVVDATVVDELVVMITMTEEFVVVVAGGALYVTARDSVRPLSALQPRFVYWSMIN